MKPEKETYPNPAVAAPSPIRKALLLLLGFLAECLVLVLTIRYLPDEAIAGIILLIFPLAVYVFIIAEKSGIGSRTRLCLDFLKIFLFTGLSSLLVMGPEDSITAIVLSIFVVNLALLFLTRRDF